MSEHTSLWNTREMEGLSPEDQARKAIRHVLQQIRDNPTVGYHLGFGSQSFSLLTEAASTLFHQPLEEVREYFRPRAN